ncbi:MAG: M16 family metallopeptidase [Cyclobacteriaceae bacterium]
MKHLLFITSTLFILFFASAETITKKDSNGFTYKEASNDPLHTRIYTLDNGLTVYLSKYADKPRIQTYIAVAAGSKTDPSHATGLAHYLEHMMFKGTSKIGTINWEKEKVELEKIENLYEVYRKEKDTEKREQIYHQIDSISSVAAIYAVANEYDKATSVIGAQGTNAYTFFEQTVYVNNIPSNQLDKWITLESERFNEMTPRLFHTELEAVYEEKNRGLDSDGREVWETLLETIFQKHPYGTQTTIGTIDHLKNPSITEIKKYFNTYYVPNNMAICMSGDFDPEKAILSISKSFGKKKRKEVPAFNFTNETPLTGRIEKTVVGTSAESVTLGFRFPGIKSNESMLMEVVSMLLSNSEAGLIDLNLNQAQRVLGAYSYPLRLSDYSIHMLSAQPNNGQSLENVEELLLAQLDSLKKGNFADWLLEAVVNDYKKSIMAQQESNESRADSYVTAFVHDIDWEDYNSEITKIEQLTKQDIRDFVKKYYNTNYVIVQKKKEEKKTLKVDKPTITPVPVNRESKSNFYSNWSTTQTPAIAPVFLDYEKDLTIGSLKKRDLLYKQNVENSLFDLTFVINKGDLHTKETSLAIAYFNYLGTDKFSATELKQELYKIGCSLDISSGDEKTSISLSGLDENLEKGLSLVEHYISDFKAENQALANLKGQILESRRNQRISKDAILKQALFNYAKYGKNNPFTYGLDSVSLMAITSEHLVGRLRSIFFGVDQIIYYGPKPLKSVQKSIKKNFDLGNPSPTGVKKHEFTTQEFTEPLVYYVPYDMVQAEIFMLADGGKYNKDYLEVSNLYNEYFGGNMGSIVFQEMRESKALAYSVRSYFTSPSDTNDRHYSVSYIGTQADKLEEAVNGMNELLDSMPVSPILFNNSKESILKSIETNRVTKSGIISSYLRAKKMGRTEDNRKKFYEYTRNSSIDQIIDFHKQKISKNKTVYLVIGKKGNIDLDVLKKYGKVIQLSVDDIFIK